MTLRMKKICRLSRSISKVLGIIPTKLELSSQYEFLKSISCLMLNVLITCKISANPQYTPRFGQEPCNLNCGISEAHNVLDKLENLTQVSACVGDMPRFTYNQDKDTERKTVLSEPMIQIAVESPSNPR